MNGLTTFAMVTDASVDDSVRHDAVARKFRKARRHSRRVRFLRIALPVLVVLSLGGIVAASYFNPIRMLAKLPIDPGQDRRLRHQGHDAGAAAGRLHPRFAAL